MNNTDNTPKCVAGCKNFTGGELRHHPDCPNYPDSFSEMYDKLEAKYEKLKARQSNSTQKIKNPNLREFVFGKIKAFIEDDSNYDEDTYYKDDVEEPYCYDTKTLCNNKLYDFVDGLIPDIKGRQYIEVKPTNQCQ